MAQFVYNIFCDINDDDRFTGQKNRVCFHLLFMQK